MLQPEREKNETLESTAAGTFRGRDRRRHLRSRPDSPRLQRDRRAIHPGEDRRPHGAKPVDSAQGADFTDRCVVCHGNDGSGQTQVGRNLYPKPPDLRAPQTQNLTDGQIRYIIKNGVRLTGMPAWSHPHEEQDNDSWKLVLFIRDLRQLSAGEKLSQP